MLQIELHGGISTIPEAIHISWNIRMDECFPYQCLVSHLYSWTHSQLGAAKSAPSSDW